MAFVSRAQLMITVLGCVVGAVAIARQEEASYAREKAQVAVGARASVQRPVPRTGPIDVNRATEEELATLPGIGPRLAARIVAHRATHGPFMRASDIDAVPGVGAKLLAKLLPHLRAAVP